MLPKLATILMVSVQILVLNLTFMRDSLSQRLYRQDVIPSPFYFQPSRTAALSPRAPTRGAPTPSVVPLVVPTLHPTLSTVSLPPSTTPLSPIPWGSTEKVGEHMYRTYVAEDPVMATVDEIYAALNKYRSLHSTQELRVSDDLCRFADLRIKQLTDLGGLDSHRGFEDYLNTADNWKNLPHFKSLGENNSAGYKQTGTHLIEWVFDADDEHRNNQMNPKWNRVCARVSGTIVEMLFGEE